MTPGGNRDREPPAVTPPTEQELAAAGTECAFVRICRAGQVPDGYVRRFYAETEHGQVELAVARLDGKAYATSNYCTHLDCLLSSGKLQDDGIRCSCHNSVFDLETGEPIQPPATERDPDLPGARGGRPGDRRVVPPRCPGGRPAPAPAAVGMTGRD